MYTLEDYLYFRGDLGFDVSPVNEIDEMVFSIIGKADFTGILGENEIKEYSEVFDRFFESKDCNENLRFGLLASKKLMKTMLDISRCRRFAGIKICNFVKRVSTEITEQMSALTVLGPDDRIYVTFRGTDDTLIGWKENCELAIMDSVPAQRDAAAYLESIAEVFRGPLRVTGHSKGGNLAVYAAAHADARTQEKIEKIISYDGPGFPKEFFETAGYYVIKNRTVTMVPKASIVGMMMENAGMMDVIDCESEGVAAHDVLTWGISQKRFLRAQELSEKSIVFRGALEKTLDKMDIGERQEMVDELFTVLSSTGADELLDFTENTFAQALTLSKNFRKSKELKEFISDLSRFFIRDSAKNTISDLHEKIHDKVIDPVKDRIGELKDPES